MIVWLSSLIHMRKKLKHYVKENMDAASKGKPVSHKKKIGDRSFNNQCWREVSFHRAHVTKCQSNKYRNNALMEKRVFFKETTHNSKIGILFIQNKVVNRNNECTPLLCLVELAYCTVENIGLGCLSSPTLNRSSIWDNPHWLRKRSFL